MTSAPVQTIDLSTARNIHIVAIGGTGMSAIAEVLLAMGHKVSGSDAANSAFLDRVSAAGAQVWVGHDGSRIPPETEVVAASTAVKEDNPEIIEARKRNIPVLRRVDLLASIARTRRAIAVAGTHGKTTTSTLLSLVLEAGGVHPSWIIGGEVLGVDGAERSNGARWGKGQWFVVEADESDATFLQLDAECVVVTNVEPDHLKTYGGWEQLQEAFDKFVASAPGARVVCIDDEGGRALAERFDVITYGQSPHADYQIVDLVLDRFSAQWTVVHGDTRASVSLSTPGLHNVLNATGALAMGDQIGVPLATGAAGIENYRGVGRRFHQRGSCDGITFIDDYAHLPTEVKAALRAAADGKWKRIVAVFQPHRYTRTQEVGKDFGTSFDDADLLILNDLYAAGESPIEGVSGEIVRDAVLAHPGHPETIYVPDRAQLADTVNSVLQPGDLCITLGAGDITKLADEVQQLRLVGLSD